MKYRIAARFLRVCHFIQLPYLFYSNDIIIQSKTHFIYRLLLVLVIPHVLAHIAIARKTVLYAGMATATCG